jgi:hypothetical protein
MGKYLHLPTHQKYGWLVFLLGFIVSGFVGSTLGIPYLITGAIQWALIIALIIEVMAIVRGKNKPR